MGQKYPPMTIYFPTFRVRLLARTTLVICLLWLAVAYTAAQPLTELQLPARPAGAMTGTQFKDYILNMDRATREIAIYWEVIEGNIPDFIRTLKPVTISQTISTVSHTATFYATPEYMSVGSD